jgi:hypothetical protein
MSDTEELNDFKHPHSGIDFNEEYRLGLGLGLEYGLGLP